MEQAKLTGYPSIDRPWLQYYTKAQIEAPLPRMSIYQYLLQQNKDDLDGVALSFLGRNITYRALLANIDAAADALVGFGIREGDAITSCLPNIPESIYLIYAASKIGAIVDLADPFTNQNLMRDYCKKARSKMVFTVDACYGNVRDIRRDTEVRTVVVLTPTQSTPALTLLLRLTGRARRFPDYGEHVVGWPRFVAAGRRGASAARETYRADAPVAILHTGGSTGVPKGALLSNDNLNALAHQMHCCPIQPKRGESALNLMPPFASYGLGNGMHTHLAGGLRLILIPTYEPDKLGEQIVKYRPNRIACSPAHYEALLRYPFAADYDLSFLRAPIVGGDKLNEAIEKAVNALLAAHGCRDKIAKGYGMTETCSGVAVCVSNEVNVPGTVGVPLVRDIISIFDEDDPTRELRYGEIGEIGVSGPNVMLGYFQMPEENAAHLIRHSDGSVWLRTGDIGYMTERGNLFINGRKKRVIIKNDGLKCYSFDVEKAIAAHPDVLGAYVVPFKDPAHVQGDLPVAYLLVDKAHMPDAPRIVDEVERLCRERVVYYAVPVDYLAVDTLPRTPIGKVDYARLAEDYARISPGRTLHKPEGLLF